MDATFGSAAQRAPAQSRGNLGTVKSTLQQAWETIARFDVDECAAVVASIDALLSVSDIPRKIRIDCDLLKAAAHTVTNEDCCAEAIAKIVARSGEELMSHPVVRLLLRVAYWRTRNIAGFFSLSRQAHWQETSPRFAAAAILDQSIQAAMEVDQLRFPIAERLATEAVRMARCLLPKDSPAACLALAVLARLKYEYGDLDAAEALLRDRIAANGLGGHVEDAILSCTLQARIALARRQQHYALLVLTEAESLGRDRGWWRLVSACTAERLRVLVAEDRIPEAKRCAEQLHEVRAKLSSSPGSAVVDIQRQWTLGMSALVISRYALIPNLHELEELKREAQRARAPYLEVELSVGLATALISRGDTSEALEELVSALRKSAASGLCRTFLDAGKPIQGLIRIVYEKAHADPELSDLLPYLSYLLAPTVSPPRIRRFRLPAKRPADSLSPREADVLRLMSRGLSNKRIAKELVIAPETVKSHAKRIMIKLGAQTRVEAVSRGIGLGLI